MIICGLTFTATAAAILWYARVVWREIKNS